MARRTSDARSSRETGRGSVEVGPGLLSVEEALSRIVETMPLLESETVDLASDSSMLLTLAQADGLIRRRPSAPSSPIGEKVEVIVLDHLDANY